MTKILALPGEGERLDRFELVAELAAGGMATVYLARFVGVAGFKRFVAIKRLHPHLAKEQGFIQMFLDEARLAARLHHPNVVPILEIGMKRDQYYLVMEYVEGDTVAHLVGRAANVAQKLPIAVVIRIVLDTLTGLHAAHELTDDDGKPLGIVHRDVSPQNILVGVDGVARITDFGVAKAQTRLANATQGGQLKGKLAYMAPEQVRGNVPVDRRADVFAAGIVAWELLTGQRLFKADGEAETLFKVVAAEVPSIRRYEPAVPPEVEVVIRRALAARPTDRFATTADFAEALEHAARTYNLVATVRQTAGFVNDLIGLDISQQREIVREWLGRSDISRSGIAHADAATPHVGVPSASRVPKDLSSGDLVSLVDDDLDINTHVDGDEDGEDDEAETRIQRVPSVPPPPVMAAAPRGQPRAMPARPEIKATPRPNAATARAPSAAAPLPQRPAPGAAQGAASGPYPPGAVSYPWQTPMQQMQVEPQPKRGMPAWTLLVPAAIILGGAVFLGMRQRNLSLSSFGEATGTSPIAAATATATQAASGSESPAPPTTTTASATAIGATAKATAVPIQTATAVMTATPVGTATAAPTIQATAAATAAATATAASTAVAPHSASTSTHKASPSHSGHGNNAAAIDSKEFGGRD